MLHHICRPCLEELISADRVKDPVKARGTATKKETCENCGKRKYCHAAEIKILRWRREE